MAAFHKKGRDLVYIYNKIKSEKELVDDIDISSLNSQESKSHKRNKGHKNLMSLRISTEASVKLLRESFPLSRDLLDFLGCLPKGMRREHLTQIFPDPEMS